MRIVLFLAVVALAGCGSDGADHPGAGEPVSVQEAIDLRHQGPLVVRGYLIERDGDLRLCEAILESYPPQCGEPSLRVEGAAPAASEELVTLFGEVDGATIRVSSSPS